MRYEYLTVGDEHQHMEPLMIELEERHGLWQRVKRQISPNYLLDKEGIIFAYRKSSTKWIVKNIANGAQSQLNTKFCW